MRARLNWALVLLMVLAASEAAPAQVPAVPGAPPLPGGPVPAAVPGVAAAPAAAPRNIWSFFMKTPEQKAQCKAHFCNSRIGFFMNNLLVPAGAATGGLLGPICPPPGIGGPGAIGGPPSAEDLQKPATSPEGAAARIKADEAQAKAKIAALEFLATVDCRYYPEAEAGLIAGLRAEKNECVRIAAAKALGTGCCCSPKVIKALTITVDCSNKDGFPAEASELVRTYAFVALERCLRKCVEEEPDAPPEPPQAAKKAMYESLAPMGSTVDYTSHILLASYYAPDSKDTAEKLYEQARVSLARGLKVSQKTTARLSGPKSLADAFFPPDSRPSFQFTFPSLPAIPSFAAIRRSVQGAPRPGSWLPEVQGQRDEPPRIVFERGESSVQEASHDGSSLPPTIATPTRNGRGNLLHIVQDAWRR